MGTVTMMGIQDKNTKNSVKSKNYPKSKTLREIKNLTFIDWLVYCFYTKCTMQLGGTAHQKNVQTQFKTSLHN